MANAGFYKLDPGGTLLCAPTTLSTPSGTYLVANEAQYTYPIDGVPNGQGGFTGGWTYYASDTAAYAAISGVISTPTTVAIVSTGTPALSGTYGCAPSDQQNLAAESTFILVNGTFTAGASMPWLDASGTPHVFTSTAQFQAFASAIASYVTQLKFGNSPATPLTIA